MLRLHPALLVHTTRLAGGRRLIAQVSADRPPLVLNSPLALTALNALPAEFERGDALEAWLSEGLAEEEADALWSAFEQAGLFCPSNGDSWWHRLEWREAFAYHHATRDYPFLDMAKPEAFEADRTRMDEYAGEAEGPPLFAQVESDGAVELSRLSDGESPDDRLSSLDEAARRGHEGLSLILDVCFGERGRMLSTAGEIVFKSIPSGGGRHPTEVHVAVFDVPGVPAGVYHYDVEKHELARLYSGDHRASFEGATLDLFRRGDGPPSAALVLSSRVERAMWRYRDPRSFRAILVDAGHAVMALRMVARKVGLRALTIREFDESQLADLLRIDRLAQPPLYVATLAP